MFDLVEGSQRLDLDRAIPGPEDSDHFVRKGEFEVGLFSQNPTITLVSKGPIEEGRIVDKLIIASPLSLRIQYSLVLFVHYFVLPHSRVEGANIVFVEFVGNLPAIIAVVRVEHWTRGQDQ